MIELTRLNNHPITVNSDLIKFVEQAPDTVITLTNGEKIVVREQAAEVVRRVVEFRRAVLHGIFPAWDRIPQPVPPGDEPVTETQHERNQPEDHEGR